jgi:hypothetical protein
MRATYKSTFRNMLVGTNGFSPYDALHIVSNGSFFSNLFTGLSPPAPADHG